MPAPSNGRRERNFHQEMSRDCYIKQPEIGPNWVLALNPQKVVMGSQVTDSIGHHKVNGRWDGGGPFYTCRIEKGFPTRSLLWEGFEHQFGLKGHFGTPLPEISLPSDYRNMSPSKFRSEDLSNLDADGATAIAQVAPTNPNANLATSLAETYKEGLPSLPGVQSWKRRTEIAKAAASEFLNVEFGWLPLVGEVHDVSSSVKHSHTILDQYRRDSGRNVRREFAFPIETTEITNNIGAMIPCSTIFGGDGLPGFVFSNVLGPMDVTQTIRISSRKWFSGAFTYAVPDQSDSWNGISRSSSEADKLLGTDLTPDILWELAPWSWAIDWFTNTGDVIHNATNFALQGLVMRYGYMMEETSVHVSHSFSPKAEQGFPGFRSFPPSSYTMTAKVRTGANPFGFGVTLGSLSATQLAIAAAVGITLL